MKGCLTGFLSFFQGVAFLFRHRLWRALLIPAFLSLLLAMGTFYGVEKYLSGFLVDFTQNLMGAAGLSPSIVKWTLLAARGAALFLSLILAILIFQLLAAIVVFPFLGPLLDKTEKLLIGHSIPVSFRDSLRNAILAIRSSLYYTAFGLLAFVFTLPLGPAQIFVLGPVEGYLLGRGSLDCIIEKHYHSAAERSMVSREMLCETIGLGMGYLLFLLIPVVGAILGPAASVAGSAIVYYSRSTSFSIRSMRS